MQARKRHFIFLTAKYCLYVKVSFPRFYLFISIALISMQAASQGLSIKRATGTIKLDAVLDEADWQTAEVAGNFKQYFPADGVPANSQSEVRLTYDDKFIYIAAKMYNLGPRDYVTPSLRRDFRGEGIDGVTFVFDTFKDRTNAFMFGINPFGVQREGLISNGGGGGQDLSLSWDNKWFSEAKMYDGYWIAEAAIPFKTIRFKEGLDSWFVNFYRIDSERAERSTWSPIPLNFDIISLAFCQELRWDKPLKNPGANVSIIPYIAAGASKDFEYATPVDKTKDIGLDAKIAVSSALNLDLTINPDFSQVEVDQQVTNLDRFEIFFPERRQFFLENADLFSNFGFDDTTPFFSRRIGVARDTSTGQNIQNPIYAGARLSGKINNNLRVGFLTMQAGKDKTINLPSTNYSVATFQHKVFSRSNIGMIIVNKQAQQDTIGGDLTLSPSKYNRMVGVDYNLLSKDNVWSGRAFYHRSFENSQKDSAYATGVYLSYVTYRVESEIFMRSTGSNYNPEVGFVRRRDIQQIASSSFYNVYPQASAVRNHGPGFDFDYVRNQQYGALDWDINFMYRIRWKSTAQLQMRFFRYQYTYLFDSFDPSGSNGLELPGGTDYRNILVVGGYTSDQRKRFFFDIGTRSGQYFNGYRLNLDGSLSYRFQPLGFVSLDFTYNKIKLPKPYNSADLFLLGPRIDLTFSKKLFWTTFVQYNSQIDNLNINSRLQWRFAPVSDIFLAYTDNYFTSNFTNDDTGQIFQAWQPRQRAIVFKITYWLNL
jgi:Domain of unknown function (DUF5916)